MNDKSSFRPTFFNLRAGICLALVCAVAVSVHANIITVTNGNDSGPGSLRQALVDANDGDTINFDPSVQTVTLTTAELAIDKSVTVAGAVSMVTVVRSSQTQFRIFHVMPSQTVTIDDLHITGGDPGLGSYGGAVLNDHASLTISNCSLTTNSSTYGGAISSDSSGGSATLAVLNSSVTSNYAVFSGGGIYNSGGTLTITNSTLNNNLAGVTDPWVAGTGGGIYSSGPLMITNSTISGNQAYLTGGGIAGGGTITSSTVSGNTANGQHDGQPWGRGGGISGSVTLYQQHS